MFTFQIPELGLADSFRSEVWLPQDLRTRQVYHKGRYVVTYTFYRAAVCLYIPPRD
jgi:hypothetical protein